MMPGVIGDRRVDMEQQRERERVRESILTSETLTMVVNGQLGEGH